MSCVALIGLMGAGKSTVGAIVAARTGRRLVDVDRVIEARTGRTVRQLWDAGGEAAYRRLERDACLDACAEDAVVLAAPGGAVLDPAVVEALQRGAVVWLRADPATLAARVAPGDHRPLLGDDPASVLTTMERERRDRYAKLAQLTVDSDRCSAEEAATTIVGWLDDHPDGCGGDA